MELVAVLVMIVAGAVIAIFIMIAIAIAQRESGDIESSAAIDRDTLAASILFQLLTLGGSPPDEAYRRLRRDAGMAAKITRGIDLTSWAGRFAQVASPEQRSTLLETAVRLLAGAKSPLPPRQYAGLLDVSFALGFQTDALARLREKYGFEYIDYAKNGRPREADRGGGATPLFERKPVDTTESLRLLELDGEPSRQEIISAYRRLAAQYHPDHHFEASAQEQSEAAARFIEVTRAYEILMAGQE